MTWKNTHSLHRWSTWARRAVLAVLVYACCLAHAQPVSPVNLERDEWRAANTANTAEAYRRYAAKYPTYYRAAQALDLATLLEGDTDYGLLAESDASFDSLAAYLGRYPASRQSVAAYRRLRARWERDRSDAMEAEFAAAMASGRAEALELFIERNRRSSRLPEARKALDSLRPNRAFGELKAVLAKRLEGARRSTRSEPTDPSHLTIYFPARTSDPASTIVYKDLNLLFSQISADGKNQRLPDDFELVELRGINALDTFVLFLADKDIADAAAFKKTLNVLTTAYFRKLCEALQVGQALCRKYKFVFQSDSLVIQPQARQLDLDQILRRDIEAASARPTFGTQPHYAPEAKWDEHPFQRRYVAQLCQLLGGPPGAIKRLAVETLSAVKSAAGNRCAYEAGSRQSAVAALPPAQSPPSQGQR